MDYVLITPARNEETFIEGTIRSVIAQTVPPRKWVIVSDGSTDRTDQIVLKWAAEHAWIELVRRGSETARDFRAKVNAFNYGYAAVRNVSYDLIGSLDADLTFEPTYFEFLISKFQRNPRLGLGGTPFDEGNGTYDFRFSSVEHVSGACQLFRRECFEEIGGYVPIPGGGIDVVAVLTARMKGWETRTFPEMVLRHHRKMGSANSSRIASSFKLGRKDYSLGRHPLWQLFRSAYQMTRPPKFVGGASLFAGYAWAMMKRVERPVSRELIAFQRREQLGRLRANVGKILGKGRPASNAGFR